jgi:uncharacterized protein YjbJ (UPF0337 family)
VRWVAGRSPIGFQPRVEVISMNKDQVKGSIKTAAGKVQEKAGRVLGSTEQQVKGLSKQIDGKAQKAVGDVKETLKGGH